ncbi:ParB/RepB/Spo0J family partition protein [Leptothrix sp. BB-4]
MTLHLADLAALDAPAPHTSGTPLMVDLDAIDEDPEQPRREFDEGSLQELAETIRARGVRQPVSVRPSTNPPGRWVLNFGARRLRAARLAGLLQIPVFVDTTADRYDQVIENEQREGLRPLELAMFVQRRLQLGESQAEIARQLGKSRQWVALVTAMIGPPDWLLQAYREGRCRGLLELHELRKLHEAHPQQVEAWQAGQSEISRRRIDELRASLAGPRKAGLDVVQDNELKTTTAATAESPAQPAMAGTSSSVAVRSASVPEIRPVPVPSKLIVEWAGERFELVVDQRPIEPGHVYVRPRGGQEPVLVLVGGLTLLGFMAE